MSRSNSPSPTDSDDVLPQRLQADLRSLYPAPTVPPAIEARILNSAAAVGSRQARHRRRLWWAGAGAAAAAAVVLVVLYQSGLEKMRAPLATTTPHARPVPGDVDGDGKVDILDAFAVARELKYPSGESFPSGADLNGDGVVDERDVELIAQTAVKLDEPKVAHAEPSSHVLAGGHIQ